MGLKSCEVNGKTRKFICKIQQPQAADGRNNITEDSTAHSISKEFKIKAQLYILEQ